MNDMYKKHIKIECDRMPFKTRLSFIPIINHIRKIADSDNSIEAAKAKAVLAEIQEITELQKPFDKFEDVNKYRDSVNLMMSFLFPESIQDSSYGTAFVPFSTDYFYMTRKFVETFKSANSELGTVEYVNSKKLQINYMIHAYIIILTKAFGAEIQGMPPVVNKLKNKDTGISEYFKLDINAKFVEIYYKGKVCNENNRPEISQETLRQLFNNAHNKELWEKTVNIEDFSFEGFVFATFVDITEIEITSMLKSELLDKNAVIDPEHFFKLRDWLRDMMKLPDLKLGLVSLDERYKSGRNPSQIWHSIVQDNSVKCSDFEGTIYEKAIHEGHLRAYPALEEVENPKRIEKTLLAEGIKGIAVAPLFFDKKLVGLIELGVSRPDVLNYVQMKRLYAIFPLFAMALKRATEEMDNKIQATIKEECTAIHPSVEWRFIDAASNLLGKRERGDIALMEDIVFPNVYPLYGATDVRGSSVERNKAIQSDLLEHLQLAKNVFDDAYKNSDFPIYDQFRSRIEKHINHVNKGLSAGDEVNILDFLRFDVEPVIKHIDEKNPELNEVISAYNQAIDPDLEILYKKRKDFEESLMIINDRVSSFIEKEEVEAQKMFPHYFEKYKTDGVEYNIYIGNSLVDDQEFNPLYLENIRLWQLINMCKITCETEKIKPELKIPLSTTQLILVQHTPISIRFRLDEKQFDVDGAYNIRYEIIKKRIDKALIKGTKERLTQPGKIAIIYSQNKEQKEYERYLEYLKNKDFIEEKIEKLVLEDLQGAGGLRALRVTVKL